MTSVTIKSKILLGHKGSGMLAAMVSTTAGLMFCLLFYNLTLYNGAKTAVDSAVRKAIRCVTPTDPECVEYRGTAADLELRWRGIKEGPGSERHFIEKHNYDASMNTQVWNAIYDAFEKNMITPTVGYDATEVPRRNFSRLLNSRENIYHRYVGEVITGWKPEFDYPFAHVQGRRNGRGRESDMQNQDGDNWYPYCLARSSSGPCCTNPSNQDCDVIKRVSLRQISNTRISETQTLRSDKSLSINTGVNSVLGEQYSQEPVNCFGVSDGGSNNCSNLINQAANSTGGWFQKVQLGIKVDSHFCVDRGTSIVEIGDMFLEVDHDGNGFLPEGQYTDPGLDRNHTRDYRIRMGGRSRRDENGNYVPFSAGCYHFNLWFRGPKSSTGGEDSAYHNLVVKRGGRYRVGVNLKVVSGSSIEVDKFRIRVYQDTYVPGTTESADCNEWQQRQPLGTVENNEKPMSQTQCAFRDEIRNNPGRYPWSPGYPQRTTDRRAPTCNNDAYAFNLSGGATEETINNIAVCSTDWRPTKNVPNDPGRLFCQDSSWTATNTQLKALVGRAENINGGCQLASLKPQGTVVCNGGEKLYSPENQYGAIGSCGTVLQDTMTNVSAYTQTVNNSQLVNGQSIGAPTFQGLTGVNDFSWNGSTNSHWVQTLYRPRDGQGNEITNPQIVRVIEDLSTPSNRTIYEHVDGNWRPDKTYFNFSLGGEVGGPDFFETRVKRLELASTTQRPIEAVYPFNQSEAYQIPDWGSTSYQNQYDYNRDCNLDYECEGRNGTYLTLEERLRAYAALELPVASDPQYTFAYNDQMLRTVEASEATNLPACSPLKPYCSVKTETSVDLGVFRISQYPSGPPACHDGTYTRCTSEVVGNIEEPGDPDRYVDVELAKAVGLQEIERFNPGYERDCQDPSCAKIEVEMTSPITATVKASYEVPLFFPLDILLGHPSIKVSSEKEEVYEMASVGRG